MAGAMPASLDTYFLLVVKVPVFLLGLLRDNILWFFLV
jgi:hypothetical protein